MRLGENAPKYFVIAVFAIGLGLSLWQFMRPKGVATGATINVSIPPLSSLAESGKSAFDANCASCHGPNGRGTGNGPPLIHDIYNPGHHSDEAFFIAARLGVRRHHWPYGDMPPQPQVTQDQLAAIVRYVRELQVANGINYRPHRM